MFQFKVRNGELPNYYVELGCKDCAVVKEADNVNYCGSCARQLRCKRCGRWQPKAGTFSICCRIPTEDNFFTAADYMHLFPGLEQQTITALSRGPKKNGDFTSFLHGVYHAVGSSPTLTRTLEKYHPVHSPNDKDTSTLLVWVTSMIVARHKYLLYHRENGIELPEMWECDFDSDWYDFSNLMSRLVWMQKVPKGFAEDVREAMRPLLGMTPPECASSRVHHVAMTSRANGQAAILATLGSDDKRFTVVSPPSASEDQERGEEEEQVTTEGTQRKRGREDDTGNVSNGGANGGASSNAGAAAALKTVPMITSSHLTKKQCLQ